MNGVLAVVAIAMFSVIFWIAAARSSVVIDGVRYHFLDDDQMISMRYARNLAAGYGPVWNPDGERVEGYTNFGWMLVMAAVHGLGAADHDSALFVRAINWLLGCVVIGLCAALLRRLDVDDAAPALAALVALALTYELLFWSINGFETTLLTALFLGGVLLAVGDGRRRQLSASTCLLAGLLPVVRADAFDLSAGVVATALLLGARGRMWLLGLAVAPVAAQFAFRIGYYGDWLPNTYYLKVAGRDGLFWRGAGHVKGFVLAHTLAVLLPVAGALAVRERRLRVLAPLACLGAGRVLLVGPDIFGGFRFLAPYVPLLLVTAAAAICRLSRDRAVVWTLSAALLATTVATAGVSGRQGISLLVSQNGRPAINTVTGVLLRRHGSPNAQVAVFAAGCLPYFSRLRSVDLLGKSDRHVARMPPATEEGTGHNRFDIAHSLGARPDFVVTYAGYESIVRTSRLAVDAGRPRRAADYGEALLWHPTFLAEYAPYPVPLPLLVDRNALFVHERSEERRRLGQWRAPSVAWP